MKYWFILYVMALGMSFFANAEAQKLPPINSLKDLPVQLVMDTMDNEDIASPSLPEVSKDGVVFFYDFKLKQLYRTSIKNQKLFPISREGSGPKEYNGGISEILLDKEFVYTLDGNGKLMCFGINGDFKWEKQTRSPWLKFIACRKDIFYFCKTNFKTMTDVAYSAIEWKDEETSRLIIEIPALTELGDANINGKIIPKSAVFFIGAPVFILSNNTLVVSGSETYQFDLIGLDGKLIKQVKFDEAYPQNLDPRKIKSKQFAIEKIYPDSQYLWMLSKYYSNGKPRIDAFSPQGKLKKSFLIPLNMKQEIYEGRTYSKETKIMNGYLIYSNRAESGFKIFKINESVYR